MPNALLAFGLLSLHLLSVLADRQRDPYQVLGVTKQSCEADIRKAYRKLAVQLHPDKSAGSASKQQFLEVQEAYELLSDPTKKGKYDQSGFAPQQSAGYQTRNPGWNFQHPFQQHFQHFQRPVENIPSATTQLTYSNFQHYLFQQQTPLLIQVYYDHSPACKAASTQWEQAAKDLSPGLRFGRIEWGQQYLLETLWRVTGLRIRGEEVPALFGYPASCLQHRQSINGLTCYVRYKGEIRADLLQQFAADKLLELPQVPAVAPSSLNKFLGRVPPHKTMLLAFSTTPHASIALRQAVQQTDMLMAAGRVQWQAEDAGFWRERLGVGRVPALVFLRGPGVAPTIFDTSNSKRLDVGKLASDNQWQVVQPLRRQTADPLGCSWGSQAGTSSLMQLCVVLVGRADSIAMAEGRATLARLSEWMLTHQGSMWHRSAASAAKAYANGKLRLTWLDAGPQSAFCKAHLAPMGSETISAVCGSDWASTLTPLFPTHLFWGTSNATQQSAHNPSSWLMLQWLQSALVIVKQWASSAYAMTLHWSRLDAFSVQMTHQPSRLAQLRRKLSWHSAQQFVAKVSMQCSQLINHPGSIVHIIKQLATSAFDALSSLPGSLSSVRQRLSIIPATLSRIVRGLSSTPWQPNKWLPALQRSTVWELVSSWAGNLEAVVKQPHGAGQVQLIAYKPGAGQLSAWWAHNHRYAMYEGDALSPGNNDSNALAEWLSQCMASSSGLPLEAGPPEQLVDDDAPGWVGAGVQTGAHSWRWMREQFPAQLPSWFTWETAQLALPILLCALLALCAQACAGPEHQQTPSASQQQRRRTARAQRVDDDDAHDRFLQMLWKADSEAVLMEKVAHGATNSGKYLVMMLVRREHLIAPMQQHLDIANTTFSGNSNHTCERCLRQFASLRTSFKQDKRLRFVVGELHMLESTLWQRQYVDAAKEVGIACPVLVWHPKRTKCRVLDCTQQQKTHTALEQVLDGSGRWVLNEWPRQ